MDITSEHISRKEIADLANAHPQTVITWDNKGWIRRVGQVRVKHGKPAIIYNRKEVEEFLEGHLGFQAQYEGVTYTVGPDDEYDGDDLPIVDDWWYDDQANNGLHT